MFFNSVQIKVLLYVFVGNIGNINFVFILVIVIVVQYVSCLLVFIVWVMFVKVFLKVRFNVFLDRDFIKLENLGFFFLLFI